MNTVNNAALLPGYVNEIILKAFTNVVFRAGVSYKSPTRVNVFRQKWRKTDTKQNYRESL